MVARIFRVQNYVVISSITMKVSKLRVLSSFPNTANMPNIQQDSILPIFQYDKYSTYSTYWWSFECPNMRHIRNIRHIGAFQTSPICRICRICALNKILVMLAIFVTHDETLNTSKTFQSFLLSNKDVLSRKRCLNVHNIYMDCRFKVISTIFFQ